MYHADATKALFFQTGAYDDIGVRPLTSTNYSPQLASALAEHTNGGVNISATSVAPIAADLLQLQTEACSRANIVNGMDTYRFRFLIEFTEQSGLRAGGRTRTVFAGYTDHVGVSHGLKIDPNMRLYFNNAVQLRETVQETPYGPRTSVNVSYSNQILHNPMQVEYMSGSPRLMTLRPEDLFALMQYENQAEFAQLAASGAINANMLTGVTANARENLNPAVYLSNTMQAFNSGMVRASTSEEFDLGEVYEVAREHTRVPVTGSKVSVLRTIVSNTNFLTNGYVTYGELCSKFPSMDHIADFKLVSAIHMGSLYQPGQGANWCETSDNSWLASQLQMSVPAIMNDCMLQFIHLYATNDTIGGAWDIRPVQPGKSLVEGLDQTTHLQHCMNRIVAEVLKPVTHYGLMKMTVDIRVDLFGDAVFTFNYDGRGQVMYTAPAFCDSLYSAVLTTNANNLVGLKEDIQTMLMDMDGSASKIARESQMMQQVRHDPAVNFNQAIDLQAVFQNSNFDL